MLYHLINLTCEWSGFIWFSAKWIPIRSLIVVKINSMDHSNGFKLHKLYSLFWENSKILINLIYNFLSLFCSCVFFDNFPVYCRLKALFSQSWYLTFFIARCVSVFFSSLCLYVSLCRLLCSCVPVCLFVFLDGLPIWRGFMDNLFLFFRIQSEPVPVLCWTLCFFLHHEHITVSIFVQSVRWTRQILVHKEINDTKRALVFSFRSRRLPFTLEYIHPEFDFPTILERSASRNLFVIHRVSHGCDRSFNRSFRPLTQNKKKWFFWPIF